MYRKSRKRQKTKAEDEETTADESHEKNLTENSNKKASSRRKSTSFQIPEYPEPAENDNNRLFRQFFLPPIFNKKRAQSSPSQLLIKDSELLKKVQETFSACSTPIRLLENRRKYAPLTPAGRDRPKLLASGNGLISIEPVFRKSLSIGSLVRGTNLSLDLDPKIEDAKASPKATPKTPKKSPKAKKEIVLKNEQKQQPSASLIGSPKKTSWPPPGYLKAPPMGKSKPKNQKGHERPPEKAVMAAPKRKPKINLDFKPEPSAPTTGKPKAKIKAMERPTKAKSSNAVRLDDDLSSDVRKVSKAGSRKSTVVKSMTEPRPLLPKAENQGQQKEELPIVEKPFEPQVEDDEDDDQGLVLLPRLSEIEQRPPEENEAHHEEDEGQIEEGESIYDANHITDRILRNVKEMRKGVQPKQLQEKIKSSNDLVIPKATNAVRIEKKAYKAMAKAVAQPESPAKKSLPRGWSKVAQVMDRERKKGLISRNSRYPSEAPDAFEFGKMAIKNILGHFSEKKAICESFDAHSALT